MDRLTSEYPSSRITPRIVGLFIFLLLLLSILAYKAIQEGWLSKRSALELNNQPTLLFFNRQKGCECALIVYEFADRQIKNWSEEARYGVPVISIDLDQRSDLGKQFKITRAPTLLLLDQNEKVVAIQQDVVSDLEPLNLAFFEDQIQELLHGN